MLTDTAARKATKRDKAYKLADEKGLFLYVATTGGKSWRMKYRWLGAEKLLTFGRYPDVSLAKARDMRDAARALLREGVDPGAAKKAKLAARVTAEAATLETLARDWHKINLPRWSKVHAADVINSLERFIFPTLGNLPIATITPPLLLQAIRAIEERPAIETAHRVRQRVDNIYAFAISSGVASDNPAAQIKGALRPIPLSKGQPALTELQSAREMITAALTATAQPVTLLGLELLALTWTRPGDVRFCEWADFDYTSAEPTWRIPVERMKGSRERKAAGGHHIVPLSRQAVSVLERLQPHTGHLKLLFPSLRSAFKPMSENAMGYLLNRVGYHGRQTPHGLRATASSIMNELYPEDKAIIDLQLAHLPEDKVEAAYNRALHLKRRRELMQIWADLIRPAS